MSWRFLLEINSFLSAKLNLYRVPVPRIPLCESTHPRPQHPPLSRHDRPSFTGRVGFAPRSGHYFPGRPGSDPAEQPRRRAALHTCPSRHVHTGCVTLCATGHCVGRLIRCSVDAAPNDFCGEPQGFVEGIRLEGVRRAIRVT